MELGNKFPREAAKLRSILAAHGLVLVGGWHSIFLLERDAETEFKESAAHRKLLKDMGTDVFIVAECARTIHGTKSAPLSTRPKMGDAEWKTFNLRLTRLAELLRGDGFRLVYHHHMGTVVQTGAEIDRMMQGTGAAVGLLLDTGHATWGGDDPVRLARAYKPRIGHVHCKDVRLTVKAEADRKNWSFLDSIGGRLPCRVTAVDYVSISRSLKAIPAGWWSRPNRTRSRRRPPNMPSWAMTISSAS
jgi:sugar phosphate isomerase/epimerase